METIDVKINFLHHARLYLNADEYSNIVISYPLGALPNTGDIIQLDGFEPRQGSSHACTLTLGEEGNE